MGENQEDRFYNVVRENILLFLVTWIVYCALFILLRRTGGRAFLLAPLLLHDAEVTATPTTTITVEGAPTLAFASETVATDDGDKDAEAWTHESIFRASSPPTLPFYICVFGLTMSVFSTLLLPFTILANDLAHHFGSYAVWLDASLVTRTWDAVFVGCHLALYVAIPFAYFYEEEEDPVAQMHARSPFQSTGGPSTAGAAGVDERRSSFIMHAPPVQTRSGERRGTWHLPYSVHASYERGTWLGRMKEALQLQSMLAFLLIVLLFVMTRLLDLHRMHPLVLLNTLSIVTTAALCLQAVPKGFGSALAFVAQLALNPLRRSQIVDQLRVLTMERNVLERSPSPQTDEKLLAMARTEKELKRTLHRSPFWRNILFLFAMATNTICWVLFMSQVAFHLLWTMWHRHHVTSWSFPLSLFVPDVADQQQQQHHPHGHFAPAPPPPMILAVIELVQTLYFTLAAMMGIARLPVIRRLFPVSSSLSTSTSSSSTNVKRAMTMHQFIHVTALCLLIGTGLPVVIRILGITRYRLGGLYGAYMLFVEEGDWRKVAILYRIVMFARATFVLVEAVHGKVWHTLAQFVRTPAPTHTAAAAPASPYRGHFGPSRANPQSTPLPASKKSTKRL